MPRACELYVLMLCVVAIATSMLALKGKCNTDGARGIRDRLWRLRD